MITFYPGPSKLYAEVKQFMADAFDSGILEGNHRSKPFMDLCAQTVELMKSKLDIPSGYAVYFVSSATECWEIIAQSYAGLDATHFYNGAFGEKWHQQSVKLGQVADGVPFFAHRELSVRLVPTDKPMLCITQNETSNGTQVSPKIIGKIRKKNPDALICVDTTSSMAGIGLPWASADIWFASVQKCFGLPSGMAVMVCSPRAVQMAKSMHKNAHYNSLYALAANMDKFQTTHTPNILSIYLLNRTMQMREPIGVIDKKIKTRAKLLFDFLKDNGFDILTHNQHVLSDTVACIKMSVPDLSSLKSHLSANNIMLGNGYGAWKESTLRIANFPAISDSDFQHLFDSLTAWAKSNRK